MNLSAYTLKKAIGILFAGLLVTTMIDYSTSAGYAHKTKRQSNPGPQFAWADWPQNTWRLGHNTRHVGRTQCFSELQWRWSLPDTTTR